MVHKAYAVGDFAPVLTVNVMADDLKTILTTNTIRVEIPECGGGNFQQHLMPKVKGPQKVYGLKFQLAAAGDKGCGGKPNPFRDVVGIAIKGIRAGKNCDDAALKADEQEVCKFMKENAAKVATSGK